MHAYLIHLQGSINSADLMNALKDVSEIDYETKEQIIHGISNYMKGNLTDVRVCIMIEGVADTITVGDASFKIELVVTANKTGNVKFSSNSTSFWASIKRAATDVVCAIVSLLCKIFRTAKSLVGGATKLALGLV